MKSLWSLETENKEEKKIGLLWKKTMDSVLIQRRRRRRRRESAEELSSASSLDDLSNDLLIKILLLLPIPTANSGLPATKSAAVLKLVSKRWYCLISDPHFVKEFMTHHANVRFRTTTCWFHNHPRPPIFIPSGTLTLEFLPVKRKSVSVLASCNDLNLLLCRAGKKDYFVCNPCTKQWLLLTPPAGIGEHCFGLVYEPNHEEEEAWFQGLNECRFRVVSITESWGQGGFYLKMWIYCSETRQWNYHVISGLEHRIGNNVVAFNGKLYWHNRRDVVAYDPFCNETVIIDGYDPEVFNVDKYYCSCKGNLRVIKLEKFYSLGEIDDVNCLTVWELCTKTRRLNAKHKRFLVPQPETGGFLLMWREAVYGSSKRVIVFCGSRILAVHPNREDTIYLVVGDDQHIITCDITNGKLEGSPHYKVALQNSNL